MPFVCPSNARVFIGKSSYFKSASCVWLTVMRLRSPHVTSFTKIASTDKIRDEEEIVTQMWLTAFVQKRSDNQDILLYLHYLCYFLSKWTMSTHVVRLCTAFRRVGMSLIQQFAYWIRPFDQFISAGLDINVCTNVPLFWLPRCSTRWQWKNQMIIR